MKDPGIEPIRIGEHVTWFYWGRHPGHANLDMALGGGAHAIHRGRSALLVDTMNLPEQAEWVKAWLARELGTLRFAAVNTHWHPDHVAGNWLFEQDPIVAHAETKAFMARHRDALERGLLPGCPPIRVVLPNRTFEGRLDLAVEDLPVELHEFAIHERGHIAVYLPTERLLIAADMLEDPLWIFHFDFAPPERQLAEYDRMLALGARRIVSTHCSPQLVRAGAYDARFIRHNAEYLRKMLADPEHPAEHYLGAAFAAGELQWWEPYAEVHRQNQETIRKRTWLASGTR
jgi:glyoxylase-like metal-dependent hydrolase (beta-lactamase superfamily II)